MLTMALHQCAFLSNSTIFRNKMLPSKPKSSLSIITKNFCVPHQNNTSRQSVNYFQPSIWHYDYIQSITTDYVEESYAEEIDRLKEDVRVMLLKLTNPADQLELIDILQRLGVAAHFSHEIRNIIEQIYNTKDTFKRNNNLYATALEFSLLRQHGYDVTSEVFNGFLDYKGNFDSCLLSLDIKGSLSLYEASFLSMEGEVVLDEARDFSSTCLKEFVNKNDQEYEISILVNHALELPLHWRMLRLEARWFIDVYERRQNMIPALLKLAKLDFNMVQVQHQEDMKYTSRWWERIGLGEKLSFARDRMVENCFWTVGWASEPQFVDFRRVLTKVNAFITTIDDIYDVYGKLEELELFTEVVNRWDLSAMDVLPDYMRICFLALHNFVHEVAFDFLKDYGKNIIPHLKKAWADLCQAFLVEAKWYNSHYQPGLQEYLENACISVSAPVMLFHAYFSLPTSITKENLVSLEEYSDLIHYSSTIFRLANDLGTSKETGDVPKSIECYMNETGASESDARRYINSLICETWKRLNKEASKSCFSKSFVQIAVNLARMSLCMYQHGDGHTVQDLAIKNYIVSLIFQPIVGI